MRLEFAISPRRIGLFLGILSIYFALQSLIAEYLIENILDNVVYRSLVQIIDLFSVNAEQTIPTWYSTLLLFAAAGLLALIAIAKKVGQDRYWRHWLGLAVIFLYLSVDEGAVIHEILADGLQTTLNLTGFWTFGWYIVAAPLVALFGLLYLRFLSHLPRRTRNTFVLAGLVYIGGALVVEAISANQWYLSGGQTFGYLAVATIEECGEMLGVVLFIYALLAYVVEMRVTVVFQSQPTARETSVKPAGMSPQISLQPDLARRSLFWMRPLLLMPIAIIGLNVALVSWALTTPPPSAPPAESLPPPARTWIDQIAAESVVVTRLIGPFGGDDLSSRRLVQALLETYDEVMVVTVNSSESSIALAADELPFDRDRLSDLLNQSGEIRFIIFDTLAVRAIVGAS